MRPAQLFVIAHAQHVIGFSCKSKYPVILYSYNLLFITLYSSLPAVTNSNFMLPDFVVHLLVLLLFAFFLFFLQIPMMTDNVFMLFSRRLFGIYR